MGDVLVQAAKSGDTDTLQELLKSEELDIKNNFDACLALDRACEKENWDCVKLLVEAGVGVNSDYNLKT